jgi:hypothetical protein
VIELGLVDAEVTNMRKSANYTGRMKWFWPIGATKEERRDWVGTSL